MLNEACKTRSRKNHLGFQLALKRQRKRCHVTRLSSSDNSLWIGVAVFLFVLQMNLFEIGSVKQPRALFFVHISHPVLYCIRKLRNKNKNKKVLTPRSKLKGFLTEWQCCDINWPFHFNASEYLFNVLSWDWTDYSMRGRQSIIWDHLLLLRIQDNRMNGNFTTGYAMPKRPISDKMVRDLWRSEILIFIGGDPAVFTY